MATLPVWTLEEELRIGQEDDSDYALVPVGGMAVTSQGHVLVSQPQEGVIREFDHEGGFVRRIGGPGDGPGEFRRLGLVGVLGDTIWAVDTRQVSFLQFFDLEGRWLDQREAPRLEPPYLGSARYYPLPDGGVVAPSASGGDLMLDFHEQPWFRWSSERQLIATLPGYLSPGLVLIENQLTLPDGRTVDSPVPAVHPFAAASWMGIAPDQSSLVRAESISAEDGTAGIRVLRFTPDGDTLAMGQLSLPLRPIPPQVADSAIEAQVSRIAERLGSEGRARRELTSRVSVPEHYPPLRSLTVGRKDRSWMALDGSGETRWLVLDADLEPLALVEIPPAFEPMLVDGDALWGTELNEFDVPRVVRYRVVR